LKSRDHCVVHMFTPLLTNLGTSLMGRELTWPLLSKLPLDVMAHAPMGISSWRYRLHVLCAAIHASGSDESDSGAFRSEYLADQFVRGSIFGCRWRNA